MDRKNYEIAKRILGDYLAFHISAAKAKWFPGKKQKELLQIEKDEINLRKLLYQSFVHKNDLCFDVGANMGNRISPLLLIGAKVVAVEPQQQCCRFLQLKFGKRITIVPKGLGEKESIKDFHIASTSVLSSFSDEWINAVKKDRFKEHQWDKVIKVEMTTLNNLIEKYGLPVFIKIDVEGYELDVLKGLSHPVKMISFEYTVPEQISIVIDCIRQIEKNDPQVECNYSVGEGMKLALQQWLSVEQMNIHIQSAAFVQSGFGDVYVRHHQ
ncbi:MAG: FkbM family methyltransferase [Chitinophagaceae bacterium]